MKLRPVGASHAMPMRTGASTVTISAPLAVTVMDVAVTMTVTWPMKAIWATGGVMRGQSTIHMPATGMEVRV